MIRKVWVLAPAALLGMVPAMPAQAQESDYIGVNLFGEYVPDDAGVTDAMGDFAAEFDYAQGRMCYYLELEGVAGADGIAIHQGEQRQSGAEVLALTLPADPDEEVCLDVDPALLRRLANDRAGHYMVVRNPGHPDGAVRGQLSD